MKDRANVLKHELFGEEPKLGQLLLQSILVISGGYQEVEELQFYSAVDWN